MDQMQQKYSSSPHQVRIQLPASLAPSSNVRVHGAGLMSLPDADRDRDSLIGALKKTRESFAPRESAREVGEAMRLKSRSSLRQNTKRLLSRESSALPGFDRRGSVLIQFASVSSDEIETSEMDAPPDLLFTLSSAGLSRPSSGAAGSGESLIAAASDATGQGEHVQTHTPSTVERTPSVLPSPEQEEQEGGQAKESLLPSVMTSPAPSVLALGEMIAKGGSGASVFACMFNGSPMAVKLMDRSKARKDQIETMVTEAELCR